MFDRDANGLIDLRDMRQVAFKVTGETPPDEQLLAYIAKGDLDGDGALDEAEYLGLMQMERRWKAEAAAAQAAGVGGMTGR